MSRVDVIDQVAFVFSFYFTSSTILVFYFFMNSIYMISNVPPFQEMGPGLLVAELQGGWKNGLVRKL